MDYKYQRGHRIAPVPLQGGVQTIQQSIYLTHNNPCGQNAIIDNEVGNTGITYRQFAQLLTDAIHQPECLAALETLKSAILVVTENPTQENVLQYIYSFFEYARIIWEEAIENKIEFEGYKTVFTCYEANGTTIFDSTTKQFNPSYPTYFSPVYKDPSTGELSYTTLRLTVPQPFTFNENYNPAIPLVNQCPGQTRFPDLPFPPYPPAPINPWCVLSKVDVPFYTILGTPAYWPFIWKRGVAPYGDQELIADSAFLINQTSMAETIMAISSLLVDPANTRTYPAVGYGFSARSKIPGDGSTTYNVCLMQFLRTSQDNSLFKNLQDIFFVRLSLQKIENLDEEEIRRFGGFSG